MITTFVAFLFVASLFCIGLHTLTRPGFLFGQWSEMVNRDGEVRFQLAKPLSECLTCMSSFYGALFFGWRNGFSGDFSALFLILLALIILSAAAEALRPGNREAKLLQSWSYVLAVLLFCAIQFEENFLQSLVFMVCISGINYVADLCISGIKSAIQHDETISANSIDQAEALQEIIQAIKDK